jgi:hypothetical protein
MTGSTGKRTSCWRGAVESLSISAAKTTERRSVIWFLMLLLVVGIFVALIWNYQKKLAERDAASKKRFDEMFPARPAAAPPAPPSHPVPPAHAASSAQAAPIREVATAVAAVPREKGRFLGQTETLVYRLLKAGIPDHEVFANVSLAAVIGAKSDQEARRLAQYHLDFVVCDKAMHVIAVVEMESAGGLQATGEQRFKADTLKAAGIHLVQLSRSALPRREEVRALVCGLPVPARPA